MRTDGQSICENRFIYAPRLRVVSECLTNSLPGHRKSTKNVQNVGTKDQRDGRINQRAKRDEKILSYSSSYQVYTHRVYTGREGPKRSIQRLSSSRCAFHANQLRFRHRRPALSCLSVGRLPIRIDFSLTGCPVSAAR